MGPRRTGPGGGASVLCGGAGEVIWVPAPSEREPFFASWDKAQAGVRTIVEVHVRDNNVDQALRALKKKMQREGLYREMRMRRHYEKPSERRAREKAEAIRRYRKLMRKRAERDEV